MSKLLLTRPAWLALCWLDLVKMGSEYSQEFLRAFPGWFACGGKGLKPYMGLTPSLVLFSWPSCVSNGDYYKNANRGVGLIELWFVVVGSHHD